MGVTAHFFAFDPRVYPTPPTMDRWLAEGALDPEMEITPAAAAALVEIQTPLGGNKRWSDNLAGDFAWSCARKHVDDPARGELDRWLSHLFWDANDQGCPCGRSPMVVADHAPWIYELDGFAWLTSTWHQIFENALQAGPGWSLLRWVWY